MIIRNVVLVAAFAVLASSAFAQGTRKPPDNKPAADRAGSADDQAACRPDVRRFCYKLEADAGDLSFLACLKEHRDKLSKGCAGVLERNGQ
jgi:hypothetical protein